MGIRIAGRRLFFAGMALASISTGTIQAGEEVPSKTTLARLEPGTEIIVLPAANFESLDQAKPSVPAPMPTNTAGPAPVLPSDFAGPSCGRDGCKDGQCELYYRDRPRGCRDNKRHTILQNRTGEPDWYKYYRREHFGYHPTTWMAWPENWLMCRNPVPGPHPYDLKQPDSKKENRPRNSTESDSRPRQRTAPERLPVDKETDAPKPLPKKGS